MDRLREGMDFALTGWRLGLMVVGAAIWVMTQINNVKVSVEQVRGEIRQYHRMIDTLSRYQDAMLADFKEHRHKKAHDNHLEWLHQNQGK